MLQVPAAGLMTGKRALTCSYTTKRPSRMLDDRSRAGPGCKGDGMERACNCPIKAQENIVAEHISVATRVGGLVYDLVSVISALSCP